MLVSWWKCKRADCRICPTCPYKWVIAQQISMRTHLQRKEVDDVMGGPEAWAKVDQADGESRVRGWEQRAAGWYLLARDGCRLDRAQAYCCFHAPLRSFNAPPPS